MTLGEGGKRPNHLETRYNSIPELSVKDILPRSGIVENELAGLSRRTLSLYIVKAIQNPAWLLVPTCTPEHETRMRLGLPRAMFVDEKGVQTIKRLAEKPYDELLEIARKIEDNNTDVIFGNLKTDVAVRAYELLGQDYPNLMFFRGADFDEDRGFMGVDFAPANLPTALGYAKGSFGRTREFPVVAMARFADVARLYTQGKLGLGTENNWARGSIELNFYHSTPRIDIVLRRLPADPIKIQQLKEDFAQKAVKITHKEDDF